MTVRTISKFNRIITVFLEKLSKFAKYSYQLNLIWVGQRIEYFSGSVDKVCNDKDIFNVGKIDSLVNTASYHKEFGFSRHNINCIIYCLDD